MTRQSFIRILLSLLLLLSQQMATTHATSHWGAALAGGKSQQQAGPQSGQDDGARSRSLAQDQGCDQCLAFAQLAAPLSGNARSFAVIDPGTSLLASITPQAARARALHGFQPRGPPQA